MSTIEAITLEYSYLLSSQLEAMRQHYESQTLAQVSRLDEIEAVQARAEAAEQAKRDAEAARLKADKRAEKAADLTRSLQASLSAERAMAEGMSARINKLREQVEQAEKVKRDRENEVKGLEETVRDLMFSLEAGLKIKEAGGESGQGGDLVVVPGKAKKKGKK
jgi:BRCA1-associated protein